jgi:AcrR family transcriptional regulator
MKLEKAARTLGRPRTFDCEKALDHALHVFWEKGYEGASLSDLTEAMGINRPSLYAAFGNKEALFHKVLDRYMAQSSAVVHDTLKEPTARAVAARFLRWAADSMGDAERPRGCLLVQSALACGDEAAPVRAELIVRRKFGFNALHERFKRAKKEGDLAAGADPSDLARYIFTVTNGMAVQAVNGATRAELRRIAEIALRAWPE